MSQSKSLKTYTILGITLEAGSTTEARDAAELKAGEVVRQAGIGPRFLTYRSYTAVIWFEAAGWQIEILKATDTLAWRCRTTYSGDATIEAVFDEAFRTLVVNNWTHDVPSDGQYVTDALGDFPYGVAARVEISHRILSTLMWQRCYRFAEECGAPRVTLHELARSYRDNANSTEPFLRAVWKAATAARHEAGERDLRNQRFIFVSGVTYTLRLNEAAVEIATGIADEVMSETAVSDTTTG